MDSMKRGHTKEDILMTAAKLTEYGLKPVARFHIADKRLIIEITDNDAVQLDKCIYAFLIGDEIARIGSSKAPLKSRLKSYERDITNGLNGRKSPAPDWEIALWSEKLDRAGSGVIFAREGTIITTPVGTFPAYLDEESILIGRHHHEGGLNRNKHR
jgi:hypothetical protein